MQINQYINKLKNVPTLLKNVKNKVDEIHIGKLVPVPVDLSKLNYAVKNDVDKKDATNAKIKNIKHKMTDITYLTNNTTRKVKTNRLRQKYPVLITQLLLLLLMLT